MTALKQEMSDDQTDSKSVRDAVRQLTFAYKRGQKHEAETEAVSEDDTPNTEQLLAATDQGPISDVMADALRRAEAVLFAAGEPLSAAQIAEILPARCGACQGSDGAEADLCRARCAVDGSCRKVAVPDG